jgi:hypothetical protein
MVVKIRLSPGAKLQRKQRKNQHVALALASLLTPGAVMACVLAFWRLAADVNVTSQFPIPNGLFSHWQVWLGLASSLQFCGTLLNRYGKSQAIVPESVEEPERELANSRY